LGGNESGERDPQTYAIIGAAMEVHAVKGCGFLEPVYQECLEVELGLRHIPFEREKQYPIHYKGRRLTKTYKADFVCYGQVIVEAKALSQLTSREEAQVLNYLKSSGLHIGLLINFGTESLQWRRIVYGP